MIFVVIVLLLVCVGIPLSFAWRLWRLDEASFSAWLLIAVDAAVFVALVVILGRWDIAGFYTRYMLVGVFAAALLISLRRHMTLPWKGAEGSALRTHWTTTISLAIFGPALVYVLLGMMPPAGSKTLEFPLNDGRFVIGQGGGISLLNHHASHRQQRYAADVTAVNAAGFRAAGPLPTQLEDYAIYGAAVISPCDGTVLSVRDDLPDLIPPASDQTNPAGNHVVLRCKDFNVELAHLRSGSISAKAGQWVIMGAPIGSVGNSGNTTEPHLHVHAVDPKTRTGLPMEFSGRVPLRNQLHLN